MIEIKRITSSDEQTLLPHLHPLYELSFPPYERRSRGQLHYLIDNTPAMHFNAVVYNGELSGLLAYWDMEDFFYLEHLAIFPEMRNNHIGTHVLRWIAENLDGVRILEAEPAEDELSTRRIGLYRRNGYEVVKKDYIQPLYQEDKGACKLWIMSNRPTVHLEDFLKRIKTEAYIKPLQECK